ncbi:hypothetical protein E4U45_003218 [Claviceps purpurea]|nr:hypothetical protein E4U45_003218 [Claviceps purpurea]
MLCIPVEANLEARNGDCRVTFRINLANAENDNNTLQGTILKGDGAYTWNAVGTCQVIFTSLPNCDYLTFPITFEAHSKP